MSYRVKKRYNNNIILAEDEKWSEVILLGKGIAFQKRPGDLIDEALIDKKFVFESSESSSKFMTLLTEVPLNQVELSSKIIAQAQEELNVTFHDSIYIGLTDHISYTISRYKAGMTMKNALLWEIQNYYPKEYQAAKNALNLIKYYEKINLSDDETGFIALHFVNAQQEGEEIQLTMIVTEIVSDILSIVKYHYQIELNEDSLNYNRFVTHIRFFARRLLREELHGADDDYLYEQIRTKMPQAKACADKVKDYFIKKFEVTISQEEMIYFMLHINRVAEREIKKIKDIKEVDTFYIDQIIKDGRIAMNHRELAQAILEQVGGINNITQLVNCATRLRMNFKDESLVHLDQINKIPGVLGAVKKSGQYQIIIGTDVANVCNEIKAMGLNESPVNTGKKLEK